MSTLLLPVSKVHPLAVELGLCVAMGTQDDVYVTPPPADLRTSILPDQAFVYVEALTPDGQAFLDLVAPR